MAVIYKDFAEPFDAFDLDGVGENVEIINDHRTYVIKDNPYYGQVRRVRLIYPISL